MNAQPVYTASNPTLSDFTYVCVQPVAQSLPVDTAHISYGQQCQPYYYSVDASDFYGADYQPNYVPATTNSNNLQMPQTTAADVVSTTPSITSQVSDFTVCTDNRGGQAVGVSGISTPPASSDYSSPGCSTSPSSTTSLCSASSSAVVANVHLPPEIRAKVFYPASAANPSGHQRTPRRNKFELSTKRVHHCTEPGR